MTKTTTKLIYHTMPQDRGQVVSVQYAATDEYLYRRTSDASDGSTRVERVSWEYLGAAITGDFEPWNGHLGCCVDDDDWEDAHLSG